MSACKIVYKTFIYSFVEIKYMNNERLRGAYSREMKIHWKKSENLRYYFDGEE